MTDPIAYLRDDADGEDYQLDVYEVLAYIENATDADPDPEWAENPEAGYDDDYDLCLGDWLTEQDESSEDYYDYAPMDDPFTFLPDDYERLTA